MMPSDEPVAPKSGDASDLQLADDRPSNKPTNQTGPSLRDFDYFAARPPVVSVIPEDAASILRNQEERRIKTRRNMRWRLGQTFLAAAAVLAWASLMWGHRYWFTYSLRSERPALALGSVTTLRPQEITHNTFVSVDGITGHRGIGQRGTRGLSFVRGDWWFVELLGSQGVFIQVPEDPARFGAFTQVSVSGRVVDPAREACCNAVFEVYQREFRPLDVANLRVIQVGANPGEGRAPYILVLLVWSALIASFVVTARRAMLSIREVLATHNTGGHVGR